MANTTNAAKIVVALQLLGCANLVHEGHDAAVTTDDAAPEDRRDAGQPPADAQAGEDARQLPEGTVARLLITRGASNVADVSVLLHDAEGTLVDTLKTDGDGYASATREAYTWTVVLPARGEKRDVGFFSYFAVEAGDDMHLDVSGLAETRKRYVLGLNEPPQGAVSFVATGGPDNCLWGIAGEEQDLLPVEGGYCAATDEVAVLVTASQADWQPIGHALIDHLPFAGPIQPASVGAFSAPHTLMQSFSGTTPAGTQVQELNHSALIRDQRLALNQSHILTGFESMPVTVPSIEVDAWTSELWWQAPGGPFHTVDARSASGEELPNIDLNGLMPSVDGVEMTPSAERPTLSWLAQPFPDRDAFAFEISLTALDAADQRVGYAKWAGIAPPGAVAINLPELPASAFAAPSDSHRLWQVRTFEAARLVDVEGYRALLRRRLRYAASAGTSRLWPALTTPGQSEVSRALLRALFDENQAGL